MKTYDERTQDVMEKVANKKKMRRLTVGLTSSLAACVVVVAISLVLFLPYATPTTEGTSPYQNIIDVLQPLSQPYRNNFEKWSDSISVEWGGIRKGMVMYDAATSNSSANGVGSAEGAGAQPTKESYQENTNLQVEGVREGDLLKQSTNYFYYLYLVDKDRQTDITRYNYYERYMYTYSLCLAVYQKKGVETQCDKTFVFAPSKGYLDGYAPKEMYLNDDCDTITVVAQGYDSHESRSCTVVMTIAVDDLNNIRVTGEKYVTGTYISSRMVDNRLLVVTDYYLGWYGHDFSDPDTFVPYVADAQDEKTLTQPEDIVCPKSISSASYAVITLFDQDLVCLGQEALLGYGSDVYANAERVYISCYHNAQEDEEDNKTHQDYTDVVCLSYGAQGLEMQKTLVVPGNINNQYSMDEYEGVLRVAVTLSFYDNGQYYWWVTNTNAALYCYDVDTWQLIGKVERFAPDGETVRSARFMGKTAYVCTAVQTRDPVFCFDLSDYDNITYTHTGEISGFSMSLTPFNDVLLGIGVDDNWDLKIEAYRAGAESVESVDKYVLKYTSVVDEYKSYLFDKEDGLIGVAGYLYYYNYNTDEINANLQNKNGSYYFLFALENDTLRLAKYIYMEDAYLNDTRAAVSNGFVYVFSVDQVKVVEVAAL